MSEELGQLTVVVPEVQAQQEEVIPVEKPKEVKIEVVIDWTEERIKQQVWEAAAKYNTFPEKMWEVMKCENWDLVPDLQSHHTYTFTDERRGIYYGDRERSFGLAQIHLPDHDVTYEQAIDPAFAIDFMAKNFAEGNAQWWTCARNLGHSI